MHTAMARGPCTGPGQAGMAGKSAGAGTWQAASAQQAPSVALTTPATPAASPGGPYTNRGPLALGRHGESARHRS